MGVQGFPTLKIVKPGKTKGKPMVEDYQGQRTAKAIVDAVVDKMPNHVKRIKDDGLDSWLSDANNSAKAILFSDKGTVSALLKALAIDYLGSISFAQVRKTEEKAVETFSVTKFPTMVLLPGGDKEGIAYDGEMKKAPMKDFLKQVAEPNPDVAPAAAKPSKSSTDKKKASKASKASSSFSKASASHSTADASSAATSGASETLDSEPTESPNPNVVTDDTPAPVTLKQTPMLPMLETEQALTQSCLNEKGHTCVLALLSSEANSEDALPESGQVLLKSLGDIASKHANRKLFPFYSIPTANELAAKLRSTLKLKGEGDVELIVTNGKRAWWKHYSGADYSESNVETWIDAIRMGEGQKEKLPEDLLGKAAPEAEKPKEQAQQPLDIKIEEIMEDGSARPMEEGEQPPLDIQVEEVQDHDEL